MLTGHVYLIECGGLWKIGVTGNLKRRLSQLGGLPFKVGLRSPDQDIHPQET